MTSDRFERELLAALRDEAYSAPLLLSAAGLRERVFHQPRRPAAAAIWRVAAAFMIVVALAGLLVAAPRIPALIGPAATAGCQVSTVTRHGSWWEEIGGERAFFHADPTRMYAGPNGWLIHVRFDPAPSAEQRVSMWAQPAGHDDRVEALLGEAVDPGNIYRFDEPAPPLPGAWYLFQQPFPAPGCWAISAAIDGEVAGTAVVEVLPPRHETPPAPSAATPRLPDATPFEIAGSWRLESGVVDGRPIPIVPGHRITLLFDGHRVKGFAGCNSYGADFGTDGRRFQVGQVGMTLIGCAAPVMASETAYLQALGRIGEVGALDGRLVLSGGGAQLTFVRLEEAPLDEIVDRTWVLESLTRDGVTTPAVGDRATIEIRSDGTLAGSTGSRVLTGRYILRGDEILATELRADGDDPPPALARQDEHIVGVIGDGFTAAVQDGQLVLTSTGNVGLVYRPDGGAGVDR
jgi:heat shock protein HslJ